MTKGYYSVERGLMEAQLTQSPSEDDIRKGSSSSFLFRILNSQCQPESEQTKKAAPGK